MTNKTTLSVRIASMRKRYARILPVYADLGFRIANRRIVLGLRQEDLAKLAKLSRGSVANIESGFQRCNLEVIQRFAKALSVSPNNLVKNLKWRA